MPRITLRVNPKELANGSGREKTSTARRAQSLNLVQSPVMSVPRDAGMTPRITLRVNPRELANGSRKERKSIVQCRRYQKHALLLAMLASVCKTARTFVEYKY